MPVVPPPVPTMAAAGAGGVGMIGREVSSGVSTCLTSSLLCSLFPRESKAGFVRRLELSKEFGSSDYPLLNFMLRNVTPGLVSTVPAAPLGMDAAAAREGLLFMYDGSCRNHLQDGITWRISKMAIKLIVYSDQHKNRFKLKNQRGECGVPVMRRQTWQSVTGGWRRHEYRLISQELSYNPQPDGSLKTTQQSVLQNFPCLVHYFQKQVVRKQDPATLGDHPNASPRKRSSLTTTTSSDTDQSSSSSSSSSTDSSSDGIVISFFSFSSSPFSLSIN